MDRKDSFAMNARCSPGRRPSSRPEREARSGETFSRQQAAYWREKVSPRGPSGLGRDDGREIHPRPRGCGQSGRNGEKARCHRHRTAANRRGSPWQVAVHTHLILRSERSERLEGWTRAPCLGPTLRDGATRLLRVRAEREAYAVSVCALWAMPLAARSSCNSPA